MPSSLRTQPLAARGARDRRPMPQPACLVATPPVYRGAVIGLFGGSFNPPHDGHRIVAATALRRLALDRLWWLVSPGNPLKDHTDLASLEARAAAVAELHPHPASTVTALERALPTTYTAATIAFLRTRHPGVRFIWIMGADNLAQFHRWRDWRSIAESVPMAIVDRPGWRFPALAAPAARAYARFRLPEREAGRLATIPAPSWVFLSARLSPLSSSHLRRGSRPV